MLIDQTAGFLCQRLTKEGITKAFCLVPAEKAETTVRVYKSNIPDIFLEEISGKWIRHDEFFYTKGIELLTNLYSKKIILLDEIGGFELLIEEFGKKLHEVLLDDIPIIGVIKSYSNSIVMKNAVGINDHYYIIYKKLRSDIENVGGKIVNVSVNNQRKIDEEIKLFLNSI